MHKLMHSFGVQFDIFLKILKISFTERYKSVKFLLVRCFVGF